MRQLIKLGILAAIASSLAGCGDAPGTVVDNGKQLGGLYIQKPNQNPNQNPQYELRQLMYNIGMAYHRTTNFTATVRIYQKGKTETASAKLDYTFAKPNRIALEVKEHSEGKKVGTKLVWNGGDQIAVKTKFVGFWMKTSLPASDDRLKDTCGYTMEQTGIGKMMNILLHPQAQVRILGRGMFRGMPVTQIEVISPARLPGVTRELFTLDQQHNPVVREMFSGQTLIYRYQMENMRLNTQLPNSAFTTE